MGEHDGDFDQPVDIPGEPRRHKSPRFKPKRPLIELVQKPFLIVVACVLIISIGYGAWRFISSKEKANPSQSQQNEASQATTAAPASDLPDAQNTETFKSDILRLEFKHPKTWKVSEANDGLRITSPEFTYQAVGTGDKSGHFRIYIRKGAREIDGKYIGSGAAIKPSEKLIYTNPGLGQRTETLLSSFGNGGTDTFSFFLIAGNFQLAKGDTLGPSYGREPDTFIIAGGYSANDLSDDLATHPVSISAVETSKAYSQALEIIKSIKL